MQNSGILGIPGRENYTCKGLEAELLSISRDQAYVAGIKPTEMGDEIRASLQALG